MLSRRTRLLVGVLGGCAVLIAVAVVAGSYLLMTFSPGNGATMDDAQCQHVGGGQWETVWNNTTGSAPTQIWVNETGYYWAEYTDSSGTATMAGWGTPGTSEMASAGQTVVNMTNQTATAEAMMTEMCQGSPSPLPWHYDAASGLFVRD
jgi:hypothetical protein